jgi:hypothetical protein
MIPSLLTAVHDKINLDLLQKERHYHCSNAWIHVRIYHTTVFLVLKIIRAAKESLSLKLHKDK